MGAGEGEGHRQKTEVVAEGRRLSEVTQLVTGETRTGVCRVNDKSCAPSASLELLHPLSEVGSHGARGGGRHFRTAVPLTSPVGLGRSVHVWVPQSPHP